MEREPLSKYIAWKRKQCGLTQKDLAEALSYTPQAISRFESLDSAFPLEFAPMLCTALSCSLDDIFLRNQGKTTYAPLPFEIKGLPALLVKGREKLRKTQEEIASSLGVSSRSLRSFEKGEATPALQVFERYCLLLDIKPSELPSLNVPANEEVPAPVLEKPKIPWYRKPWIWATTMGASVALALAVTLPLMRVKDQPVTVHDDSSWTTSLPSGTSTNVTYDPNTSTYHEIASSVEPVASSSTHPKYGAEDINGAPAFLEISYQKREFNSIGDTIEIDLSNPYKAGPLPTKDGEEPTLEVSLADASPTLNVSFDYEGTSHFTMTLVSARNGEGFRIHVVYNGTLYAWLGLFQYHTGETVYLEQDVDHKYPISRFGIFHGDKSEVTMYLEDTTYLKYYLRWWDEQGRLFTFGDDINVVPTLYDCYLNVPQDEMHYWYITVGFDGSTEYVYIPKMTEQTGYVLAMAILVQDEQGPYFFFGSSLVIHVSR